MVSLLPIRTTKGGLGNFLLHTLLSDTATSKTGFLVCTIMKLKTVAGIAAFLFLGR